VNDPKENFEHDKFMEMICNRFRCRGCILTVFHDADDGETTRARCFGHMIKADDQLQAGVINLDRHFQDVGSDEEKELFTELKEALGITREEMRCEEYDANGVKH